MGDVEPSRVYVKRALGVVDEPHDWRSRRNCAGEDPELFFPIGETGPAVLQIAEAKAICWACEVRQICLDWACETNTQDGIFGALTGEERRSQRRRETRAARKAS